MIRLRSALFNLLFQGWSALMALAMLAILPASVRYSYRWSRAWVRGALFLLRRLCRLDYRVEGLENLPAGPCIVASKHQSAWDTLIFALLLDCPAYVLKRELLWIPLFGWQMRHFGMIAVDRGGRTGALKAMLRDAKARAAEGRPIVIFPEGTRTAPGDSRPYHPGVAALYQALGLPAVPVALNSGCFWGRRSFMKRPGTITLKILPPIPPGLDRRAFAGRLQTAIETESQALAARAAQEQAEPLTREQR